MSKKKKVDEEAYEQAVKSNPMLKKKTGEVNTKTSNVSKLTGNTERKIDTNPYQNKAAEEYARAKALERFNTQTKDYSKSTLGSASSVGAIKAIKASNNSVGKMTSKRDTASSTDAVRNLAAQTASNTKKKTTKTVTQNSTATAGATRTLSNIVSNGIKTEKAGNGTAGVSRTLSNTLAGKSNDTSTKAKSNSLKNIATPTAGSSLMDKASESLTEQEKTVRMAKNAMKKVNKNAQKEVNDYIASGKKETDFDASLVSDDEITKVMKEKGYSYDQANIYVNERAKSLTGIANILKKYGMSDDDALYYAENWNTMQDIIDTDNQRTQEKTAYKYLSDDTKTALKKYLDNESNYQAMGLSTATTGNAGLMNQQLKMSDENNEIKSRLMEENNWSEDDFNNYLTVVNHQYNQEMAEETQAQQEDLAKNGSTAENLLAWTAARLTSPVASLMSAGETAMQTLTGDKDPYARGYALSNANADLQSAQSEEIKDSLTEKYGKTIGSVAAFGYNATSSTIDSAENMLIAGGIGEIASGLGLGVKAAKVLSAAYTNTSFGASAFQQQFRDSIESGMGEKEAIEYATASGIFEGLFESLSLDKIYSITRGSVSEEGIKRYIKDYLISAGIEGTEEGFTDLADWMADSVINGDYSEFNRLTQEYGFDAALKNYGSQLAQDMAAGTLSGASMGAVNRISSGSSVAQTYSKAKSVMKNETLYNNAVNNALNMDEDTRAYQLAKKAQSGEDLTTWEVADMLASASDSKTVTQAVYEDLKSQGMTDMEAEKTLSDVVKAINTDDTSNLTEKETKVYEDITNDESYKNEKAAGAVTSTGDNAKAIEVALKKYEKSQAKQSQEEIKETQQKLQTNEAEATDRNIAQINNTAKSFEDEEAQNIFKDNYQGQSTDAYYELASKAFNAGQILSDVSVEDYVKLPTVEPYTVLNDSNLNLVTEMYQRGQELRATNMEAERVPGQLTSNQNVRTKLGTVDDSRVTNKDTESYKVLKPLAEKLASKIGVSITLTDETMNAASGSFTSSLANVVINTTTDNPVRTLLHETSEFAKSYNPEGMGAVVNAVLSYSATMDNKAVDRLTDDIKTYREVYRSSVESDKTLAEAGDEYVFDFMAGIIASPEHMGDFINYLDNNYSAKEKKSILDTVKDFFQKLVNFLKGIDEKQLGTVRGRQTVSQSAEKAQELFDQWLEAVDQASSNLDEQKSKAAVESKKEGKKASHSVEVNENNNKSVEYTELNGKYLNHEEATQTFKIREGAHGETYIYIYNASYIQNTTWSVLADAEGYNNVNEYKKMVKEKVANSGRYVIDEQFADSIMPYLTNEASNTNEKTKTYDVEKDVAAAEEEFGTTRNWELAGYLDVNGKLLDFSEGQGYRVQDHREISSVLDLPDDAGYSDGLIQFMNEGNIRLQSYGIDIAKMYNSAQKSMLREFFNNLDGEVTVDFSDENGDTVGSAEYTEGTASSRILNDIADYFETGNVPEGTYDGNDYKYSDVHYSLEIGRTLSSYEHNMLLERLRKIQYQHGKNYIKARNGDIIIKNRTSTTLYYLTLGNYPENYVLQKVIDINVPIDDHEFGPVITEGIEDYERNPIYKRIKLEQYCKAILAYVSTGLRPGDSIRIYNNENGKMYKGFYISADGRIRTRSGRSDRRNYIGRRGTEDGRTSFATHSKYSVEVNVDEAVAHGIDVDLMDLIQDSYEDAINILENGAKSLKNVFINENDVKELAKQIIKDRESNYSADELSDNLMKVFAYMKEHKNASYDVLLDVMKQVATPVAEDIYEKDLSTDAEYQKLREYLKNTKIALNSTQKKEVQYAFGSYREFTNKLFGIAKFSDNGSQLDDIWSELVEASGNRLDVNESDADQPMALASLIENYKPETTDFGLDTEHEAFDIAIDIFSKFFELQARENNNTGSKLTSDQLVQKAIEYRKQAEQTYQEELKKQKEYLKKKKIDDMRKLLQEREQLKAEVEKAKVDGSLDEITELEADKKIAEYDDKIKALQDQDVLKIAKANARKAANKHKYDYAEARRRTAIKNSLKSNINYLNGLLGRPKNKQFIPTDMVQSVIGIVSSINMDTGKSKNMAEKLAKLKTLYDRYNNDSFAFDYDEKTSNNIKALQEIFQDRNYTEISNAELEMVLDIVKSLRTQIANANKLLNMKLREDARDTAREINVEIKGSRRHGKNAAKKLLNKYIDLNINAQRWFNKTSGWKEDGAWNEVFKMIDDGQHTAMNVQRHVNDIFKGVLDGKENQKEVKKLLSTKKDDLVDIGLKDENGKPVMVTRDMRLAVILHSKNDSNLRHMMDGGFRVPNLKEYADGKIKDAYADGANDRYVPYSVKKQAYEQNNLGIFDMAVEEQERQVAKLTNDLSEWEKKFLKAAEDFLWDYSGSVINETSTKLKGYSIARVKNYMPIHVDDNFVNSDVSGLVMDRTIEGQGFLKERINSGKPIYLEGLTNVILRQTKAVSDYAGYAIPMRNLNMLLNTNLGGETLKKTITDVWSATDMDYLVNLMKDLQGGRGQSDGFDILKNKFAGSIFLMNASVAIRQAASFPTAAATLGYGTLAKTLVTFDVGKANTNGKLALRKGIKELEDINPLLWYRSQGYATQELGDIKNTKGINSVMPFWLDWISMFDIGTVRSLEYASVYYVDKNYKNLKKGSDEYWQKVSDVFTKAVEETQPNYTALQRADIAKRSGVFAKILSMFKTQAFQNFGIMYDATGNLIAKSTEYKLHKTEDNKRALSRARNQFGHAITSQVMAAVVYNLMGTVASALLKRQLPDWWDEEEGRPKWEQILKDLAFGSLETLASSFVAGGELYEMITKFFTGETYYGMDVQSVEMINDTYDSIKTLFDVILDKNQSITETEREQNDIKLRDAIEDLAGNIGYLTGIPVNNIDTILKNAFLYGKDIATGSKPYTSTLKTADSVDSMKVKIYDALVNGSDDYDRLVNEQVASKIADNKEKMAKDDTVEELTREDARSKVDADTKSYANSKFQDEEITFDDLLEVYKKLGLDEDTISDSASEQIGNAFKAGTITEEEAKDDLETLGFEGDDLEEKYATWANNLVSNELGEDYSLEEYAKALEEYNISEDQMTSKMKSAINAMYKADKLTTEEYADALEKYGVPEKDINSNVSKAIKADYKAGTLSEDQAIKELQKDEGLTEAEAYWKVQKWVNADEDGNDGSQYGELEKIVSAGVKSGAINGAELKRVIKEYEKYGKEGKDIPGLITSDYKEDYLAGHNKANIYSALLNVYRLSYGCTTEEAKKKLNSLLSRWYKEAGK